MIASLTLLFTGIGLTLMVDRIWGVLSFSGMMLWAGYLAYGYLNKSGGKD